MSFYEWFNKRYKFELNDFRAAAEIAGYYDEWIEDLLTILYNHMYCNGNKAKAKPYEEAVKDIVRNTKCWLTGEIDCIA